MGAFFGYPLDFLRGILHLDTHFLQIGYAFPEVFAGAGELQGPGNVQDL